MDLVLKNITGMECWVFTDEVIVYLDIEKEHAKRLANVFKQFRRANLQLQPEKCVFAKGKVIHLGFELSYRGIEASPDKVKTVQNFPKP
jgi:Reverse transcriptase (RNA-dependent DNA polymerase).